MAGKRDPFFSFSTYPFFLVAVIVGILCLLPSPSLAGAAAERRCPRGWARVPNPNRGSGNPGLHCAKSFTEQRVNWGEAKALCVEAGGKLVEVNSPAENEFLQTLKKKGTYTYLPLRIDTRKEMRTFSC